MNRSVGTGGFDTVLSCNVFEHRENEGLAFSHARDLLRPVGNLVLVLPVHPALFGPTDRLVGHARRYDLLAVR